MDNENLTSQENINNLIKGLEIIKSINITEDENMMFAEDYVIHIECGKSTPLSEPITFDDDKIQQLEKLGFFYDNFRTFSYYT